MIDNMIVWANDKLGNKKYAGWCLSFIEDALEKSNDIEIFGGDSAKEYARCTRTHFKLEFPKEVRLFSMNAFVLTKILL